MTGYGGNLCSKSMWLVELAAEVATSHHPPTHHHHHPPSHTQTTTTTTLHPHNEVEEVSGGGHRLKPALDGGGPGPEPWPAVPGDDLREGWGWGSGHGNRVGWSEQARRRPDVRKGSWLLSQQAMPTCKWKSGAAQSEYQPVAHCAWAAADGLLTAAAAAGGRWKMHNTR